MITIKILKNVLAGIGLISIIGIVTYFAISDKFTWFSPEREEFRLTSPKKEFDAVVTVQEPGGFGSSNVRLYVVPYGTEFGPKKDEFRFEAFKSHTVHAAKLKWIEDRKLVLVRNEDEKIYFFNPIAYDQRDRYQNISVEKWNKVIISLKTE